MTVHPEVCHALDVKGLPCITRQGFAMHYTSRVCHTLHGKGLPYIIDQQVALWHKHCIERCLGVLRDLPVVSTVVVGSSQESSSDEPSEELLSNSFSASKAPRDLMDFRWWCGNRASVNVGMQTRARSTRTRAPMRDMINCVNSLRRYNVFSRSWCQSSFCK